MGQQNLVCFNCRSGVFTAILWLTCRLRLLLFSWQSPKGAVGKLFLNSCHHVRAIRNLFELLSPCEDTLSPLRYLDYQSDERRPSLRGRDRLGERSPLGSQFPESLFLNVPGTTTDQVRTCGFRRKSSSLDRAPKIWDSVRLNSFGSFLVTVPLIFQNPRRCNLEPFLDQACCATDRSWYFQLFLSKLLLSFSYSSKLHWYWVKSSVRSEHWIEFFILTNSDNLHLIWGKRV